ncbi:MAG: hypothetical protein KGN02_08035 [bacterium]|nr:hypothetical protein [bacterium]
MQTLARRTLDAVSATPYWLALLALGALVRIVAGAFVSNTLDMRFYGSVLLDGSFHRPLYQDGLFSYPPLWGYVLLAMGRLSSLAHVIPFQRVVALVPYAIPGLTSYDLTKPFFSLLIKAPILAGDAAVAWFVWALARQLGASVAASRAAVLAWWLNPLVLFGSTINASWDCIVPLAMLSAVLLAWRRAWTGSGVMIALGILTKLTPLYALLTVGVMAISRGTLADWIRRLLLCGLGIAAALVVAFIPLAAWGEFAALRQAVFARVGSFSVGGANLWALASLRPFGALGAWAQTHRVLVLDASTLVLLGGIATAVVFTLRRRNADLRTYLCMLFAIASIVLIASPFSQPTYVLWMLPIALVLATVGDRFWRWYALLQTLFASLFLYSVRSVQDLLMPLCVFAHACDPVAFAKASLDYRAIATPLADNLQITIDALSGFGIGVVMIVGFVFAIRAIVSREPASQAPEPTERPGLRIEFPAAIALGASLIVALGALAPFPQAPSVELHSGPANLLLEARGFDGHLYYVRFGPPRVPIHTVYAYFDARYPYGRGVSATFRGGFAMHLRADLALRNDAMQVVHVDADTLARVLRGPAEGRALTVLDGMLPIGLHDPKHDALKAWIARGGVVFWAGEPFDLLYAKPASGGATAENTVTDYTAWRSWYAVGSLFPQEVQRFSPPIGRGTLPSMYYGETNSTFARTTFAVNVGPMLHLGGAPLGFIDDKANSSVNVIPYGHGRVVFFGDGFDDEILAAQNVAQILASNAWYRPRASQIITLVVHGHTALNFPPLRHGQRVYVFGEYPDDAPFSRVVND